MDVKRTEILLLYLLLHPYLGDVLRRRHLDGPGVSRAEDNHEAETVPSGFSRNLLHAKETYLSDHQEGGGESAVRGREMRYAGNISVVQRTASTSRNKLSTGPTSLRVSLRAISDRISTPFSAPVFLL